MRPHQILFARACMLFIGLIQLAYAVSLLGIIDKTSSLPWSGCQSGYAGLFFVFGVLPIIAVLKDNEYLLVTVMGVTIFEIFAGALGFFGANMCLAFALISMPNVFFSSVLSVEKVALNISGEMLSLKWSQF